MHPKQIYLNVKFTRAIKWSMNNLIGFKLDVFTLTAKNSFLAFAVKLLMCRRVRRFNDQFMSRKTAEAKRESNQYALKTPKPHLVQV